MQELMSKEPYTEIGDKFSENFFTFGKYKKYSEFSVE